MTARVLPRIGRRMASLTESNHTPEQLVAELVLLLDLQPKGGDRFIGRKQSDGLGRVFGGQAIAQALGAARLTVDEDRHVHSLHAYFLRGGSEEMEMEFRVKRDLDGASFSNRRVVASQDGEPILNLITSYQKPQEGLHHQMCQMPDVPPPEDLPSDSEIRAEVAKQLPEGTMRTVMMRPRPIDFRSVEPRDWMHPEKRDPKSHVWFRTVAPLPDYRPVHRAVLALITDFQLLATALQPHGLSFPLGDVKAASLDHAVWFHDDFRADEWMLYVTESPWSGLARGYGRGQIFSQDGRLVASVAQEGMIRPTKK